MRLLGRIVRRLGRSPRDQAGEPFVLGGERVGWRSPDGSITFAPGISVSRHQQANDPYGEQNTTNNVKHSPEDARRSRIAGSLPAMSDLGSERVIDPLADSQRE